LEVNILSKGRKVVLAQSGKDNVKKVAQNNLGLVLKNIRKCCSIRKPH
jgi:hypothetical protein